MKFNTYKTMKLNYVLTFFFGISISILIGYSSYHINLDKKQMLFDSLTKKITHQIYNRMDTYREVLYSGLGFFEASNEVTRKEWSIFVTKLQIQKYFSGIQGLGYTLVLRENELEKNIKEIRSEGFESYKIFPEGKRDLYTSIIFLEPFNQRNIRAFGYDMYSEKIRRKAMNNAIETGLPSLSGKVKLVQENGIDEQTGFLFYAPLYKKNMPLTTKEERFDAIKGFVYAVFRTKDFLTNTIKDSLPLIDLKMYDGNTKNSNMLLYESNSQIDINENFNKTIEIKRDGHSWLLEINAKESYFKFWENINSLVFTLIGLFITFLLSLIIKRQNEIEILKDEALINVSQGVIITDNNHNVIYTNKGFENLTGYSSDFINQKNPNLLQGIDSDKDSIEFIKNSLSKTEPFECDILNYKKDGTPFWNRLAVTPILDKNNNIKRYIGIQNDITKYKLLEKQTLFEKSFLENILNNTNAIIALIDTDGVMLRINDYGKNFVGYTQEEISSEPFFWKRFIPKEMREKVKNIFIEARKGNLLEKKQNSWISKSGEEKIFEWSNKLIKDDNGEIQYLITVGIDVTQEVIAQEEYKKYQKQLELSVKLSGLVFWEFNIKTNTFTFNDDFYAFLGTNMQEQGSYTLDTQTYLERFIPQDSRQIVLDKIKDSQNKDRDYQDSFEYTMKKSDNTILQVLVNYFISYDIDGKPDKAYGTKYDLTKQKNKENELQKSKEQVEYSLKAKSEFLANMSHEIRTPLNGIIGLTQLTLETNLSKTQKNYLTKSIASSNALLHVINNILDYSKIEANKIELESIPFELDKLFHQLSDLFAYETSRKNIKLIFSSEPIFYNNLIGDPFRIMQVMINLIGNAIKFTPKGYVEISLDIKNIKEDTLTLNFKVKDTGIGISKETQKKLFKEFSQVDASNTRIYGGSGLGLVISKKLAHMMNGDVLIQSEIDKGSIFSFKVDVEYKKTDYSSLSSELKNKKLLVANSSENIVNILEDISKKIQLNTKVCKFAKSTLEVLEKEHFDFVLIDFKLDDMQGIELIKTIDNKYYNKDIKTIITIPSEKKEEFINLHNINKNQILINPFSVSKLFNLLINKDTKKDEKKNEYKLKAKGKVLLVEDNEINLLVAKQNLQNFGLTVEIATDGQMAVQKAKLNTYNIIFMDLQMPILDGFKATSLIREFNKDIPIIALSAAVMQDDIMMTKEAGMNNHLSKPIDIAKLKEVLIEYLDTSNEYVQNTELEEIEDSIDGININELLERFNNNKNAAYQALQDFLKNKEKLVEKLLSLKIDSSEFNSFIHNLKGMSGNLSLKDVFKYTNKIDEVEDIDSKKEIVLKLKDSLNIVEHSVNNMTILKDEKGISIDFSKTQFIEELNLLYKDVCKSAFINFERRNIIIENIKKLDNKKNADELELALCNYDYNNAKIIIEEILNNY
ncbi:CHASE domain-containing protein [Poseidonibacter sp.]|uniref:CHASE domain-containing hybrid sensor histidine kinase/response regulator n=1 Tax=Poseidonibacter sp. TaxID=2321188 RepID=UPI003C790EE9